MYTGTHTVSPATLASTCERINSLYLSIYLGAVFADLQFFPDAGAGAHHASECKLRSLASSFSFYYDNDAVTIL
jgi:hypothetical protein